MSNTVDSRVVEMRFDNGQFEKGVSTSMSTLDKLKQKLGFEGATKGLDNVSNAAKNVNMNSLGSSVETVSAKFSALQVVGVTALANITNSVVNAGKQMFNALMIEPLKDGFQEYEMTLNAIQTTMAGTGKTAKEVQVELKKLDEYADKTIYSTADMLNNLPKFTNAGVDLEEATKAMIGIANATALAGGDAQKASIAYYNLGQSIGTGYLSRMDYNSINNAGIATMQWKEAMVEAAIEAETLTKTSKGLYKAGNKTFTLQQLFIDGLQEQWATKDVLMKVFSDYGDETTAIGEKAFAAAQDIKTFTMMMDSLKATAGTGWKDTWEIIFGDLDEAKKMWTGLNNFISNILEKMSDFRNMILESALATGLNNFFDGIDDAMVLVTNILEPVKNLTHGIDGITRSLEEHDAVVDAVIRGEWNNWHKRWNALTEDGYDWIYVQNKVNEKLGNSKKRTSEYTKWVDSLGESTENTNKAQDYTIEQLMRMSEAQLKALDLSDDQIASLKQLASVCDKLGLSYDELVEHYDEINGRWLMLRGFENLGNMLTGIGTAIKEAWTDIFPEATMESIATAIFNFTAAFSRVTNSLKLMTTALDEDGNEIQVLNENGEKLKRTLSGIFAALDIVLTIVGGPLKIAFKILTQLIGAFGFNILDVTAVLGDALVWLRDLMDSMLDFSALFDKIVSPVKNAVTAFKEWIETLKSSENLPQDIADGIVSFFGKAFNAIKNFVKKIPGFFQNLPNVFDSLFSGEGEMSGIGKYLQIAGQTIVALGKTIYAKIKEFLSSKGFESISSDSIAGLVNGFKDGASKAWEAAVTMVTNLVTKVKEFLGIHSPSTVFAAIGGFIVAGLVAGLKNGIPDSLGAVKDLFQPMLDWLKGMDFGAIFAAIIGVGTVATAYKGATALTSVFDGLGSVLEGTGELLAGVGRVLWKSARQIKNVIKNTNKVLKGFKNVLNGIAFEHTANGIKTLAIALLMLVGAIILLTFIEPGKLWNAVGVIFALAVILGILAAATSFMSKSALKMGKDAVKIDTIGLTLLGMGAAILLIAMAVKTMGSLDPKQAKQGFDGLRNVILAIAAIVVAFGLCVRGKSAQNIDKFGGVLIKLGIALLLMAYVAKSLGEMDSTQLAQGMDAVTNFAYIIAGLMLMTKLLGDSRSIGKIGGAMLGIAGAIAIMAIVVKMLGDMYLDEVIQGTIIVAVLGGMIVGLMAATKLITGSKHVDTIGGTLLKIALAIGIMGIVVKMLGGMEPEQILRGTLAITAFAGIIVGLMAATKLVSGSTNVGKIGGALLAISAAIAIMAFTAFLLSAMSWEGFAKGALMITLFGGIIIALMATTRLLTGSKNVEKIGGAMIAIAAAIGILAVVAILLGLVKEENLAKGITAVAILSGIMMGLIAVTSLAKNRMGTVIALTVAIAVLAGAAYLLSTVNAAKLAVATASLSILLGMLALVIAMTGLAKNCMANLIVLTVAIAVIAGALYLLAGLPVEQTIGSAIALGGLMLVMTGVLALMIPIGAMAKQALMGVVALAALTVPLAIVALILTTMTNLGVKDAIPNAIALSTVMLSMAAACAVMSLIPIPAAVSAALGLSAFVGIIATLLGILGGLSKIPGFKEIIADGGAMLSMIGNALGAFVGSIIAGFTEAIISVLPAFGQALSDFMVALVPFITISKTVDMNVLEGAGILVAAILAMTVAELFAIIGSIGGVGLVAFGQQLSDFAIALEPFIKIAGTIDPKAVEGVKTLADTIITLTQANLLEGLASFLSGGSSIEKFAEQMPILGQGLVNFSDSLGTFAEEQMNTVNCAVKAIKTLASASAEIPNTGGLLGQLAGDSSLTEFANQFPILGSGLRGFLDNIGVFTEEQVATVNCAAQAIKALAEASSQIPNSGGWIASIVGENDLGTFADQFPNLGLGLAGFLSSVGTFTEEQASTVECAAQAVKSLAEASSQIPNSGGWIASIVGENDLGTFADQFPKLGTGLRGFLDNIGTFTEDQISTVDCAAKAVATLASVASEIPNEGGWISKIVGDNNLGTFADNFPVLGTGLRGFIDNIGTFTAAQIITISSAVSALKALSGLADADLDGAKKHISGFGDKLPGFAKKLKSFCDEMPDSQSMYKAIDNINRILAATKNIANADSGALATFASDLKKVGSNAVKKFVEAFTGDAAKADVEGAAEKLGKKAVDGLESNEKAVKSAGSKLGEKAADAVGDQDGKMKSAGKDLGSGLVKGIEAKETAVYWAGYALGQKAVEGEKDGQKSASPSKLTIQAGKWIGEGLVIGMGKMGNQVYKSGYTLGETATSTISSSISRIADMVNTDIDSQPTIRPVLDLSDVRSGTATLGDMLNLDSTVGVSANVRAISSMMSLRGQNGVNADVVSAIDKLNKKMDNIQNASYTINGITYDDGSNITDAVRTLVRATQIERRV